MQPLCCRPLPVQRLGNMNVLVMDVVRYQKHHCLSCGLVLAFNLLKFALHLPLSFGIYYLMSSSLSHAQLLQDSNCLLSPPLFAFAWTALLPLQEGWFCFSPLLLSIPISWRGQEHDSSSFHLQDNLYVGHPCPWGAADTAKRKGHLCQQRQSFSVKINLEVPIAPLLWSYVATSSEAGQWWSDSSPPGAMSLGPGHWAAMTSCHATSWQLGCLCIAYTSGV